MRRWLIRVVLFLLLLPIAAAAAIAWRLWRALPETTGTVRVQGLRQATEVVRDVDGVPHIRASSEADAVFALGYVHAQDRLWQMEFQRRVASGRLSEVLGVAALETDRLMRTIGFARAAREALLSLDVGTRALIDSYVGGVNAYVRDHSGVRLPIEFAMLGFAPAPWRAEDVLAWQKVMGWSMSTNMRSELLRLRLRARVGAQAADQLLPAYADGGPLVLPDYTSPPPPLRKTVGAESRSDAETASAVLPLSAAASPLEPPEYEPIAGASNNWVVSGARTSTGLPFLANDPHLATQAPAVWYVAHVSGGALDVIGATLPGTPAVVIGHNRKIAWGVTNMMSDVQDLFVEQIDEQDRVLTEGRWEPMRVLHETIAVRGAQPSRFRVRITPRGPLVSDLFDERRALALRWTGHDADDRTASAFFRINLAHSWEAFLSALDEYHLPMLNFAYADVDGNIGYAGPGALPLRAGDGRAPLDGSLAASHWRGYVPRDELPRSLNPVRGFIASANNQVVDGSYPYRVSTSFDAPYRAARIAELLDQLPRATLQDMQRVQTDQRSAQAGRLVPFLLRASPRSDHGRRALEALRGWNRSLSGDSAGAAIFRTFAAHAAARLLADDLGPALWADYRTWSSDIAKALDAIARNPESRWCDDVETATRESCAEILGVALESSLEELVRAQGTADIGQWRWDRQNHVRFPHLPFEASPLFRTFFSREVTRGGDAFTIDPSMPIRDQMLVASYRQIIDLSNLDASVFILPLGQSGHWLSGRYSDLLRDWNEGRYRTLRFSRKTVEAAVDTRLVLQPINH